MPLSLPNPGYLGGLNFVGELVPLASGRHQQGRIPADFHSGLFLLSKEISISGSYSVWGPLFAGYTIASLPLVILFFMFGKLYVEGLIESGLKV